jgi:biopolymer transport protein TolQ
VLTDAAPIALLLQMNIWDMVLNAGPLGMAVMGLLLCFSVYSWTVIFSKSQSLRGAKRANVGFLRAFRKAGSLEAMAAASESYRPSPLAAVFEFGYEEVARQVKMKGRIANQPSLERALQLGVGEELAKLERNLNWLATTASVSPFIGLFGTVLGIIRAFQDLGQHGATSLRTLGPGIGEALIATAVGLFAAIPAAIFYNHFGHAIRELGARMDDFALEFLNVADRGNGD